MKKIKKILSLALLLLSLVSVIWAENDNSLLIRGLEAYKQKDWTTALFFLRKASTLPENVTPETWYVLIMAEVYASDLESVLTDGAYFIQKFSQSPYVSQVEYQMARATFLLEDYNQALVMFEDFCKKYPNHDLYSSSLFWKAESLYQLYNFVDAEKFFKEVITNYPESPKVIEAAFRVELLEQRAREEKLLYLLRVTGEENLAAREDYERQIRQYQSEESINFKMKVTELSLLVESLQEELAAANTRIENLLYKINELTIQNEKLVESSTEAKKAADIATREAELQKQNYEAALELQLKEAEQKRQEELQSKINTEEEVDSVIFEKEQNVVPSHNNNEVILDDSTNLSEIDYELMKLYQQAKELEDLLQK